MTNKRRNRPSITGCSLPRLSFQLPVSRGFPAIRVSSAWASICLCVRSSPDVVSMWILCADFRAETHSTRFQWTYEISVFRKPRETRQGYWYVEFSVGCGWWLGRTLWMSLWWVFELNKQDPFKFSYRDWQELVTGVEIEVWVAGVCCSCFCFVCRSWW